MAGLPIGGITGEVVAAVDNEIGRQRGSTQMLPDGDFCGLFGRTVAATPPQPLSGHLSTAGRRGGGLCLAECEMAVGIAGREQNHRGSKAVSTGVGAFPDADTGGGALAA